MLSLAFSVLTACSWNNPGHDVYKGTPAAALQAYTDISPDVRARLAEKIERQEADDVVLITRDKISGSHAYSPTILGMHFGGRKRVCFEVTRDKWGDREERGLVYCVDGKCILVPDICKNVSRVYQLSGPRPVTPQEAPKPVQPYVPTIPDVERLPEAPKVPSVPHTVPKVNTVPEPGTWILGITALLALWLTKRRKS